MKMTVVEIAKAVSAKNDLQQFADVVLTSVAFDTRELKAGALFVPLIGNNDGHDYINNAMQSGAKATFWQVGHPNQPTDFPVIEVDDPLQALQQLSQYYLQKINPQVVAITGSNGKTTTKDLTAAVLASKYNVTKTHANFNNEIGVPMTILAMATNTEILVVEMGMDRPGQLDFLSNLVQPDVAAITMIGEAHIEFFGTRDKIADAKMEITHGLKEDGYFIYDGDEPLLRQRASAISQSQQTFGKNDNNTIYSLTTMDESTKTSFVTNQWPDVKFTIPMLGDYNVNNAMIALLMGNLFEVPVKLMKKALADPLLTANRTEWIKGRAGEEILSDVYNSNPTAVKAVLKAFTEVSCDGRRIAVLGDMLELGEQSPEMHAGLANFINGETISEVYLIGKDMQYLQSKLSSKYSKGHLHYYAADELDQLSADLQKEIRADDKVLLKASHGIHLERLLKALTK